MKGFSYNFRKREGLTGPHSGLTRDSHNIRGTHRPKSYLGPKNVLGIIFSTLALQQFAECSKTFHKKVPVGHLGLRNFPQGVNQFLPPFTAAKRTHALVPRGLVFQRMEPRSTTYWHTNGSALFSLVHLLGGFKCKKNRGPLWGLFRPLWRQFSRFKALYTLDRK